MRNHTWTDLDETWERWYQDRIDKWQLASPEISVENARELRSVHEKMRHDLMVLQTFNERCLQWHQIERGLGQLRKVAQNLADQCEARMHLQQERSRILIDLDRSESAQDSVRTQKLVNELAPLERRLRSLRFQGDDGKAIRLRIHRFASAIGLAFERYDFSRLTDSACVNLRPI